MRENLTHAIEDYLKAIYKIQSMHGRATTNQLAESLDVTPASISGMIKKLAATTPPLVLYEKHRGVKLTTDGEKIALEILRHHRLLELFLHQILGFSWDQVHEEADRLEHVISEEFEARIAEVLGDPLHDPHGDPIPQADLSLPPVSRRPLRDMRPGQRATIQRVRDYDPALLSYLENCGIVPHAEIEVLEYSKFDENLTIRVLPHNDKHVLGSRITSQVFVKIRE